MLEFSNLCHCDQQPWKLISRDFWSSRRKGSHFLSKNVFEKMLWGILFVLHLISWGVNLTAYLGTSSHISSWSLHLRSSRGVYLNTLSVSNGLSLTTWISEELSSWHWQFCIGGISENVIWKFELISGLTLASQRSFLGKTNK